MWGSKPIRLLQSRKHFLCHLAKHAPLSVPTTLSSDDVFQQTSARYRAVEPSSGSNVISRRARPGLAVLRPHTRKPPCLVCRYKMPLPSPLLSEFGTNRTVMTKIWSLLSGDKRLLTTYRSKSTLSSRCFGGPASRHGSLNSPFQVSSRVKCPKTFKLSPP